MCDPNQNVRFKMAEDQQRVGFVILSLMPGFLLTIQTSWILRVTAFLQGSNIEHNFCFHTEWTYLKGPFNAITCAIRKIQTDKSLEFRVAYFQTLRSILNSQEAETMGASRSRSGSLSACIPSLPYVLIIRIQGSRDQWPFFSTENCT